MLLEIFCARPNHVYVSVPKTQADRLLKLPHLNPNGVPVFTQLHTIKGWDNVKPTHILRF